VTPAPRSPQPHRHRGDALPCPSREEQRGAQRATRVLRERPCRFLKTQPKGKKDAGVRLGHPRGGAGSAGRKEALSPCVAPVPRGSARQPQPPRPAPAGHAASPRWPGHGWVPIAGTPGSRGGPQRAPRCDRPPRRPSPRPQGAAGLGRSIGGHGSSPATAVMAMHCPSPKSPSPALSSWWNPRQTRRQHLSWFFLVSQGWLEAFPSFSGAPARGCHRDAAWAFAFCHDAPAGFTPAGGGAMGKPKPCTPNPFAGSLTPSVRHQQ